METIKTKAACCTLMYYSEYFLITLLSCDNMSKQQDDEATVEVRPGVLEGINGEYRITGGKLGDGQQAIVSASLSALPSTLPESLPTAASDVQA